MANPTGFTVPDGWASDRPKSPMLSAAWNGNENGAFTFMQEGPAATSTPVRAGNNVQQPVDPVVSSSSVIAGNNAQQPADPQPASQPQGPGFWDPANDANAVLPDQIIKPTSVVPKVDPANDGAADNQPQGEPLVTRPAGGFRNSPQNNNPQTVPSQDTAQTNPSAGSPQGGDSQGLENLVDPAPIPEVPSFGGSNPQGGSGQSGQNAANGGSSSESSDGSTSTSNNTPSQNEQGLTNVANPGQGSNRQGSNNQAGSNQVAPGLGNLIGPSPRPQISGNQGSSPQDAAGQPAAIQAQSSNEQISNGSGQSGQNPANVASILQNPGAQNPDPQDASGQTAQGPGIIATPWQNPGAQGSNAQGQAGQSPAEVAGIPQGAGDQGSNTPLPGQGAQSGTNSANGVAPIPGGSNPQAIGQDGQAQSGQSPGNFGGSMQDSGAAGVNPQVVNTPVTTFQLGNQRGPGMITIPLGTGARPTNAIANGGERPAAPVITVASQILTISDPSAIAILGTVIRPGAAGVDISGTPVSLAPSGNLVIGSSLPIPGPTSSVITIAGKVVTANPSSFDIAGTPVRAGGPRVTVSGVPVSLGSSGNLVVGDDTIPAMAPKPSVFTVGSVSFTANPTAFEVGGATLSAGGPGVTVDNTPVSLNPQGSLVIASNTIPLRAPAPSIITANGQAITLLPDSGVAVGGQTLRNGGQAATVGGVPMSVGPAGLFMGSETIPLPTSNLPAVTTNGVAVTFQSNSQIAVDGQTLSVGGQAATVNGVHVTVGSAGVVIGSDTVPLPGPTLPAVTTNGVAVTFESNNQVAVDGQTLSIGGPAATVNGVPVSIGTAGVIIGSDTIPLQTPAPTPSTITTNGVTATIDESGHVVVDGQTLSIGGQAATINDIPITVAPGGLVIGPDTVPLQTQPPTASTLTTDGQIVTFQQSGRVAVGGTTLSVGGQGVTVSGEVVSVATDGLVIGSDTVPLPTPKGVGESTSGVAPFYDGGRALRPQSMVVVLWGVLGMVWWVLG